MIEDHSGSECIDPSAAKARPQDDSHVGGEMRERI
jgi:hypothetical protein